MSDPTPDATLIDMQQQIDLLRAEVERLRQRGDEPTPAPAADEADAPRAATRRGMLKLAGATAAGAIASAGLAGRAAADTGYTTGGAISVGDVVRQQLNGSRPSEAGFLFATTSTPALTSNTSFFPSALAGWALDGDTEVGVFGLSTTSNGQGVTGSGTGESGVGVYGIGQRAGMVAEASNITGAGVRASGGALGVSSEANAVDGIGVRGAALGDEGIGVDGNGGRIGVRGYTEATNGIGGSFAGRAGALQVSTWLIGAPPDRGIAFEPGVIEADAQGDLWFCYKGGNPGDWRKITGRSTAGAFHAVAPGRVYDSRAAAPSPGTITGGQSRTISVADKRNPDTGAVTLANLVPAGATAIAANVTIVSTDGAGFVVCNPGGITSVDASTINWSAPGQALANGVILALDDQRRLTIVAGGGSTHVIIDVTGYFR
jgi:hypothetical protein